MSWITQLPHPPISSQVLLPKIEVTFSGQSHHQEKVNTSGDSQSNKLEWCSHDINVKIRNGEPFSENDSLRQSGRDDVGLAHTKQETTTLAGICLAPISKIPEGFGAMNSQTLAIRSARTRDLNGSIANRQISCMSYHI